MSGRRNRTTTVLLAVLTMFVLAAHQTAWAEEVADRDVYEPPVYAEETITLLDAIRMSLAHVPSIRLQREDAFQKEGIAQEAAGQFDLTLIGDLNFEYKQDELTKRSKRDQRKRRTDLREDADELALREDAAEQRRSEFARAREVLDEDGDLDSVDFTNSFDQSEWNLMVKMYETADPALQSDFKAVIRDWVVSQEDVSTTERDDSHVARLDAEESLRKLGTSPVAEVSTRGGLSLELQKQYRTGIGVAPFLSVNGGGSNFKGKPRSSQWGGKGLDDNYKATIGFRIDLPLGRGRGFESAAASERASTINHEASLASVTHTASVSVRETMIAYWALVAAQERLEAYERSFELHEQLLGVSERLVRANAVPRANLARARAREAEARASIEQSRRELHSARLSLARTIGLEARSRDQAPLAANGFPDPPDTSEVTRLDAALLADDALKSRYDYRAALLLRDASGVLARAAMKDLRRSTDLAIEVSASGRDEDAVFVEGVAGAFEKWYGPSAKLGLTVDWPLRNQAQKGRHLQRQAIDSQQRTTTRNLERTIRSNVVLSVGSLQEEALLLQQYALATEYYRESVESEMERFSKGLTTLIDAITTEQRKLDSEIAYVNSKKRYAELLSTLRFETGGLVMQQPDGGLIYQSSLLTLPIPDEQEQ